MNLIRMFVFLACGLYLCFVILKSTLYRKYRLGSFGDRHEHFHNSSISASRRA